MSNLQVLSPDAVVTDLTNCHSEPIRIPSLIQPHGMMIAARISDLRIIYVSENSFDMMGLTPETLFEMTLTEVLGAAVVESIQSALAVGSHLPPEINTFAFRMWESFTFDAMSHAVEDMVCIELEPSHGDRSWEPLYARMDLAIGRLQRSKNLQELCAIIPDLIWELTGYDRVMMYRFDYEGHGEIIAERKEAGMEPFLGLHYPATDIPQQARELYLLQRCRTIVDVGYRAVRLLGHPDLDGGKPLDMTYCGLRSVSPIHIEYLENMGVKGTFGVSLICDDKLWGMILCHHRSPKLILPEVRALCDFLGQLISLLIGRHLQCESAAKRLEKRILLKDLNAAVMGPNLLTPAETSALLWLTGADGALIQTGGRSKLVGEAPGLEDATSLMNACRADLTAASFSSREIGKRFPQFAHLSAVASGVLFVPLAGSSDGILWFRAEVAQSVRWAGKPDSSKLWTDDGFRLSPRKSFAAWEEIQRGRSLRWTEFEIEAALDLEQLSIKASADQEIQDQLDLEKLLREKRIEALGLMAAGLAHEINNPLSIIFGRAGELLSQVEGGAAVPAENVRLAAESILKTSQRAMRILRGLRGFASEAGKAPMELADIGSIVDECMGLQEARFERHGIEMRLDIPLYLPPLLCREVQVGQILTNLLNNAFDAIIQSDVTERWIRLTATMHDGETWFEVTDSGPGIEDHFKAHLMEPFFTTKELGVGMGVGLSLSRMIAQEHGGTLILSKDTPNTCFRLVLPRYPPMPQTSESDHP